MGIVIVFCFFMLTLALQGHALLGLVYGSNVGEEIGNITVTAELNNGTTLKALPIVECPGGDDDGVWCLGIH